MAFNWEKSSADYFSQMAHLVLKLFVYISSQLTFFVTKERKNLAKKTLMISKVSLEAQKLLATMSLMI